MNSSTSGPILDVRLKSENRSAFASSRHNTQPVLPRSKNSIWAHAETARDELFAAFRAVCDQEGYDARLIKSHPFDHPVWVELTSWLPRDGSREVTDRRCVMVRIFARDFHRFKLVYSVTLIDRNWSKTYELCELGVDLAASLARFVLGRQDNKPSLAGLRLRERYYQLWRPRNKVDILYPDVVAYCPLAAFVIGLMLLKVSGILALILLIAAVVGLILLRRRRAVVFSPGKPLSEPRWLVEYDSWQTVISGLGSDADGLRADVLQLIRSSPIEGCIGQLERRWDWGLDGIVEREQIAVQLRRGVVLCQIYSYDDELYVGWKAHLNRSQWVERTVTTGLNKQNLALTEVKTVEHGTQMLTDYDLVDVKTLSEWVHVKIVARVKRLMAEREIDQEINFDIIRDRDSDRTRDGGDPKAGPSRRSKAKNFVLGRTG